MSTWPLMQHIKHEHACQHATWNITCFPPSPTALETIFFHLTSLIRRGPSIIDAPQRKANPLTGDFNSSSRQSDVSEHLPMFTCFFVADADILNAVCQVPKRKPANFKKIFRWSSATIVLTTSGRRMLKCPINESSRRPWVSTRP